MNINVSLPNIIPNSLSPPTDSARRDNQLRQVIEQPKEVATFAKEPEVGAEKDRSKPQVTAQYPQAQEQARVQEREAHAREQGEQGQEQQQQQQAKDSDQQGKESNSDQASASPKGQQELTDSEQKKVDELSARDREVRIHEAQHQAVGGQYASAAKLELERGPDGKQYAVGGEVSISTSEIPGDPQATIAKMEQVQRAALAPAEPSSQDRQVAAQAQQKAAEAQQQLSSSQFSEGQAADEPLTGVEDRLTAVEQELAQQRDKAQQLQQRFPDIAQQMQERNQNIEQRYASAAAFRPQSQFSLQA
ncbi:putative metalloprotease CJM1_0395 family protein [Agarivorans sp. MS3-6]